MRSAPWLRRTAPIGALLLLSLLWALADLQHDIVPNLPPSISPRILALAIGEGWPLMVLSATTAAAATLLGKPWPAGTRFWRAVQTGLGLFVLPALLLWLVPGGASQIAIPAMLTLTPFFALLFEPYLGEPSPFKTGSGSLDQRRLLAALAAVAGTLCIFPVFPAGVSGWNDAALTFALTVTAAASLAAANCVAVREAQRQSMLPFLAVTSGTAALPFAMIVTVFLWPFWQAGKLPESGLSRPSELWPLFLWQAFSDLIPLLLLFWLLRRMQSSRMTLRYVLAPMFAVLIGLGLLHHMPDLQTALGLSLMATGTGYLLFAPEAKAESTGLSLR